MNYKSCFSTSFVLECFIVKPRNSIPYFSHTIPTTTASPPPFPHPPMLVVLNKVCVRATTNPGEASKGSRSLFKTQPAPFCTYILTVHFCRVMPDGLKALLGWCCDGQLSSHISPSGAPVIAAHLYCFPLRETLAFFTLRPCIRQVSGIFEMHQTCTKQFKSLRDLSLAM